MLKCPNGHSGTFTCLCRVDKHGDFVEYVDTEGERQYICDECGVRFVVKED